MRSLSHYLLTLLIIPVYGIQVCPFIESLNASRIALPVAAAIGLQYTLRQLLIRRWLASSSLQQRVGRRLWSELGLFAASALGLMIYNTFMHGFPLVSGLKVLIGVMGLGFFAAVDLALAEERQVARLIESGQGRLQTSDKPFPMSYKVAIFTTVSILTLITVFILLVIKDLDWIVEVGESMPLAEAQLSILKEFAFVLAVVLPHTLNIIHAYSRNLKRLFGQQTSVMTQIAGGSYGVRVPVTSDDEFGVIAAHTNTMAERIERHTEELMRTRDVAILSLATLAETRDNETGAHILRTQRYVRALAQALQEHPDYREELDEATITLMFKSAPLHDIGKVGIPDAILLKPGKLTAEEFKIMKTHAQLGADALAVAERELGSNSFLRYAREIALSHHEKWDGSGYPQGLKGNQIPVSGRLMAVADVYDALISKRVYKPAFSHEKAMGIIRQGAGSHFDPTVIEALNRQERVFQDIAARFHDENLESA